MLEDLLPKRHIYIQEEKDIQNDLLTDDRYVEFFVSITDVSFRR
jgi:hypothetical protein